MSNNPLPAALYHAHHFAYQADITYWQSLVDRCPSPALELGCGTGRVLLPLIENGRAVWGLERDADMLSYLRQQMPPNPPVNVCLHQADMTAFKLEQSFGLIFIPCNTISTLASNQRRDAFQHIRSHLQAQGVFAASLPNPLLLRDLEPQTEPELEDEFIHPETGNPVQVSSAYWLEGRRFFLNWYYDQLFPDGRVERTTVSQQQHLLDPQAWEHELQQAGFRLLSLWGNFNRRPYTANSPHLIWEAQLAAD